MDSEKLKIIKELMEQLQGEMGYSADDFEERLGRKKPAEVKVLKIESDSPDLEKMEEEVGEDLDSDSEEGESPLHKKMVLGGGDGDMEDCGPDADFKKRLMKLRA